MDLIYTLLAGACLLGLVIRSGYELLKKTGRVDTQSKPIFALVFAAMLLLLGSWPFMAPLDPRPLDLPAPVRWLGMGLVMVGAGLALGGLIQLRGLENIDHLVTGGLFAKMRHPMYYGFILWMLGWVIYFGALTSLIVACVGIANILYWRKLEEEKATIQFGEEYRRYCQATWF